MGRICPILNHPLTDGVLVDDEAVVNFIQKRNIDFLPTELVCRSCKQEVIKLFNKKLKRARELYKSQFRAASVSSLKTSKTSSTGSSVYGGSEPIMEIEQEMEGQAATVTTGADAAHSMQEINGRSTHSSVQQYDRNVISTAISNQPSAKVLSENGKFQTVNKSPAAPDLRAQQANVTRRKRTIRDFLTEMTPRPAAITTIPPSITTTQNYLTKHVNITAPNSNDVNDDNRRLSQEPTTSRASNSNKRPRTALIVSESEDDDDARLSLNAVNGTRLPHIQPIPPKRKPQPVKSLARDIMDEYIKDVTGG